MKLIKYLLTFSLLQLNFTHFCLAGSLTESINNKVFISLDNKSMDDFLSEIVDLEERVNKIIDKAANEGEFLIEKAGQELLIAILNINYALLDQQTTLFKNIKNERESLLRDLNNSVENLEKNIYEDIENLQDILLLELGDLANRFPFIEKDFYLWKIKGYSQILQEKGLYQFELIGNAFNEENKIKISIGDYTIDSRRIIKTEKHKLSFFVPVEILNTKAKLNKYTHIPFKIEITTTDQGWFGRQQTKTIFLYESNIVLLPRIAGNYTFNEYYQKDDWSKEKTASGYTNCPPTGKSGRWTHHQVSVTIPRKAKVVSKKRRTDLYQFHDWGSVGDYWTKTEGEVQIIGYNFSHQIHDRARGIFIEVKYKEPIKKNAQRNLYFEKSQSQLLYGTHIIDLHPQHQTYTFKLIDFLGREVTITPANSRQSYIKCDYDNNNNLKRLICTVNKPEI